MNNLLRRTPLRVRLVAVVVLLVGGGLAVSAVIATSQLHSYLLSRLDTQLVNAQVPPNACTFQGDGRPGGGRPFGNGPAPQNVPSQFYVASYDASGRPQCPPSFGNGTAATEEADQPNVGTLSETRAQALSEHPFTVSSATGGGSWRVAVNVRQDGDIVVVASSLSDLEHTVSQLALLESVIGVVVLLLIGGVAYFVIRQSLRPLIDVEHTAAAIASGDLSRRVPDYDPRTEVGRLTRALNGMLGQIERAFSRQRESEQAARASEDRMRRFIADASHELRTPLTSIRGFAELYRQGAAREPKDVARAMQRVEDEATRMGVLVDDLLLLARLDEERPLEQVPVDLLTVAGDAVQDARVTAPNRTISLDVEGDAPVVIGDDARLRQVVNNLVTNALRHTPDGTPVVVRVGTTGDADSAVAFVEVEDRGPGLDPDAAARIFERFYRVDSARNRADGGSGLGLSIVSALVAAHGGRASVVTAPGEGATFRIELPLAPAGSQPADSQESAAPQRGRRK
jgi:two-component system OmpR family sensor kinase